VYKPLPKTIKDAKHFGKLKKLLTSRKSVEQEQKFKKLSSNDKKILQHTKVNSEAQLRH